MRQEGDAEVASLGGQPERRSATVTPVYAVHSHHSAWSGYPRFVERLGDFIEVAQPGALRVPRPLLTAVSRRRGVEWFGTDQLTRDLTAARHLARARNEVVHLLYGETDHLYAGRLRAVGHRRGNRLVATFHQPPALLDQLLQALPEYHRLDHVIALGSRAASHLKTVFGADRVSQASHGIDTEAWQPRPHAQAAVPTCACVGSWFRDFDVLEDVIRLVRASEPAAEFEVVTAPDRVHRLSALPGVRARSRVSDHELRDVYSRAWVFVLPLKDAVSNNALLEAMACGTATVVTAVGDVADYTGADGALHTEPDDAQGMADAVLSLLGDKQARTELGWRGRAHAEANDLRAAARGHAEIYRHVAARAQ